VRARIAVALAVSALACGGGAGGGTAVGAKELAIDQVDVVLQTSAPFSEATDFPARLQSTIEAALAYWGGTWADLRNVTVTLTDAPSVPCRGGQALGCYENGELRLTTRDPSLGTFSCVEQTVLVHEIGHAVIGDADHQDPRWMQMDSVSQALSGRVGYGPDGEDACPIYVSVWRHPLGSP
jgi:hypothetical protein